MSLADMTDVLRITAPIKSLLDSRSVLKACTFNDPFLCLELRKEAVVSLRCTYGSTDNGDIVCSGVRIPYQMFETMRRILNAAKMVALGECVFVKVSDNIDIMENSGNVQVIIHNVKEAFGELAE